MRLRLATFNLENLGDRPGGPSLAERIAVLHPQLARLDADVFCLQEVQGDRPPGGGPRGLPALDALLEGTVYAGFARACSTSPDPTTGEPRIADVHNLVTLTRLPIRASRSIRHELVPPLVYTARSARPGPQPLACRFDRPILHSELGLPGGRLLHVLNLHLKAPLAAFVPGQKQGPFAWKSVAGWAEGYFVAAIERAGQALEARLHLERLFDAEPEALVAVAGDLNAEDHETALRLLCAETADTGNGELAPRSLVPLARMLPEDRRYSVIHHGRRLMLDHVLVSRTLLGHARELEVHAETLDDELAPSERVEHATESYHAPLVATFELPEG